MNLLDSTGHSALTVTGQVADDTGNSACLVFVLLAATCVTASCPVREMAYPGVVQLKPNSITLPGSELAPNIFGASSELAPNMFGASSELVRS